MHNEPVICITASVYKGLKVDLYSVYKKKHKLYIMFDN